MSRFAVIEDLSVHGEFQNVGALQDVDLGTRRSEGCNEVNELAASLGMQPVFGPFMK